MGRLWLTSNLSTYYSFFVVFFAKYLCFHFVRSLIISFVIDRTESRGADITICFSRQSLQKVLTICQRYMIAETGSYVFFSSKQFFYATKQYNLSWYPSTFLAQTTLFQIASILKVLLLPTSSFSIGKNLFIYLFLQYFILEMTH